MDAYWPAQRLAVELDGSTYHQTRRAFEADRERDVALLKAGVRTARITTRPCAGSLGRCSATSESC